MNIKETERGFARLDFKDYYGEECSLQKSSIMDPDCIWLGMNEPNLREEGWHALYPARMREYKLPSNVHAFARMHLTRDQVAELLPYLQRFVATGELV